MTTSYSIMTAMVGVLLAVIITDKEITNYWYWPTALLAISFICIALGVEKLSDSLDEDDIDKYLAWLLSYNIGAISMFLGIALYIPLHYHLGPCCIIAFLIIAMAVSWKWIKDIGYLLFKGNEEYEEYKRELLGEKAPEQDRDCLMKIHSRLRKCFHRSTVDKLKPVLVELRPSRITPHGVGVFAVTNIKKGKRIFDGIPLDDFKHLMRWSDIRKQPHSVQHKVVSFCVGTREGFVPPDDLDFNKLSIEWYLNHSCDGNIGFDSNGDFIAIKNIRRGDELAYDYGLVESNPTFRMQCTCGSSQCRKVITGNDWKKLKQDPIKSKFMHPYLKQEEI
ncbi:MAG: SET domain-containing protein-lysine N-methyltransferase [Candidatus Kryptoniota bacterium]